jgi:hypothetical protein
MGPSIAFFATTCWRPSTAPNMPPIAPSALAIGRGAAASTATVWEALPTARVAERIARSRALITMLAKRARKPGAEISTR